MQNAFKNQAEAKNYLENHGLFMDFQHNLSMNMIHMFVNAEIFLAEGGSYHQLSDFYGQRLALDNRAALKQYAWVINNLRDNPFDLNQGSDYDMSQVLYSVLMLEQWIQDDMEIQHKFLIMEPQTVNPKIKALQAEFQTVADQVKHSYDMDAPTVNRYWYRLEVIHHELVIYKYLQTAIMLEKQYLKKLNEVSNT